MNTVRNLLAGILVAAVGTILRVVYGVNPGADWAAIIEDDDT